MRSSRRLPNLKNAPAIVGGTGLFYYAGQAVYIDGEDIMLPVDAKEQDNSVVGGLNLTQLMRDIQSRTSTPMTNNGTAVIYSASKGEQAADGLPGRKLAFHHIFRASAGVRGR